MSGGCGGGVLLEVKCGSAFLDWEGPMANAAPGLQQHRLAWHAVGFGSLTWLLAKSLELP